MARRSTPCPAGADGCLRLSPPRLESRTGSLWAAAWEIRPEDRSYYSLWRYDGQHWEPLAKEQGYAGEGRDDLENRAGSIWRRDDGRPIPLPGRAVRGFRGCHGSRSRDCPCGAGGSGGTPMGCRARQRPRSPRPGGELIRRLMGLADDRVTALAHWQGGLVVGTQRGLSQERRVRGPGLQGLVGPAAGGRVAVLLAPVNEHHDQVVARPCLLHQRREPLRSFERRHQRDWRRPLPRRQYCG